jgi:hypothetical protein
MLERRMRVVNHFGVLVLLLASCLSPAMACVVPAQMTPDERACCSSMNYQCGQMGMPGSNGCCRENQPNVYDGVLNAQGVEFHPAPVSDIWLTGSRLANPTSPLIGRVEQSDSLPPQSPPSSISILRI